MTLPELRTARLCLRIPGPEAAARVVTYYRENAEHFAPTAPPVPAGQLDVAWWEERLQARQAEFSEDKSARFVAFAGDDPDAPVVGTAGLGPHIRGPFQATLLGYGIAARYEGQGLMTEAVSAVIQFAFGPLRLHRVMANHLPDNHRSAALLRRLGFVVEGFAPNYLYINGAWRDHVLNALTNPTPMVPPAG